MRLPFFWIDAFADRVFSGNPVGLVWRERWLPDDAMQRIAFENGLSETTFFVRTGSGIDCSLPVVDRLLGAEAADQTMRYLEYGRFSQPA